MTWTFEQDLDAIFARMASDWPALANKRLFVTGGTGFIGRWMLEALRDADLRLGLAVRATILTRDPAAFAAKVPHLAGHPGFRFVAGDVLSLEPDGERYDLVIHAATDASADLNLNNPVRMFDTVVTGTHNALGFACAAQAKRVLFLSSGAVYGAQSIDRVKETSTNAPDPTEPKNAYAEGKRAAEMLCAIHAKQFGLEVVSARIFALLGPLLSLDIHFAAGNFIRDAIAGRIVTVKGPGSAIRSYLYATDLTVWLWTMLLRAEPGSAYNVGSEEAISIADLARRTASLLGAPNAAILGQPDPGWNPGRYVPSSARIRQELGVMQTVGLDDAIRRTALWNGWKR